MMSSIKYLLAAALLLVATLPTFSQINNDDCATAQALTVYPTATCDLSSSGTTLYAQASGLGNCEPQSGDAWFRFEATATAHTLRLFDVRSAYNYSQTESGALELFTGDCATGQLQRRYCTSLESTTFGEFVPGQTYYLRIVPSASSGPLTFQLCVTTPNQPPPPNDACAGAALLPVEPAAQCSAPPVGSTAYATLNPAPICPNCPPYLHNDVWYSFTATQALQVVALSEVKTFSQPDADAIYVETFTGDCATPTSLYRDTAFTGQGSIFFTDLTVGQDYRLRLYGNTDAVAVQFNLCVTAPPLPVNDECAGAISLVPAGALDCQAPLNGSLLGALADGADCQGNAVRDVWYQFTATSPAHRLALTPATNDRYGFEVYGGNDCNGLTSLTCNGSDHLARTLSGLTVGATYFLRVFSPTVQHFDFQICLLTLPAPPANDDCAGAIPLAVSTDFTCDQLLDGSTLGATSSAMNCGGTTNTHDVWFSFVAAGASQRLILTHKQDIFGNNSQYAFEAYTGNCGQLTSLACGHLAPYYTDEMLLGGLTVGATYFVRVYSLEGSNHAFSLCLQTLPPPPANLDCAHAEVLTSMPLPGCLNPTLGNTLGVVAVETSDCGDLAKSLWYQFTAVSPTEVLEVSNVQSLFQHYGSQLALYEGTACGSLTLVRCYYVPQKIYLNNLTPGKTYYLRWVSNHYSAHTFQICLNHYAPPANDACAGALPLIVHGNMTCYYPTVGTTAGATAELPDACQTGADVWFRFTAIQATQQIEVSNVQAIGDQNFMYLQAELLAGSCGNLSSLYCWPASLTVPSFTQMLGDLTPGQTYYLRLTSIEDIPVRFEVCVLTPPTPPVNDNCINATVLAAETVGNCTPIIGSTENASPTPGLPLPPPSTGGDTWYSFVANEPNQDVSIGYVIGYGWPYGDGAIVEAFGSACGQFNSLAKQTIEYAGALHLNSLTPGTTYYVRIIAEDAAYIGFSICISAPVPAPNDECANALPFPFNTDQNCANALMVNTLGATQSRPDCDGNSDVDIWYQFIATDVTYRFDVTAAADQSGERGMEVLGGDCDNLVPLFCRGLPTLPVIFQESGFTAGQTYYVRVWGKPNTIQSWNVCAYALPPSPVNDECANALVLPINVGPTCATPTFGSTLSATASPVGCYAGVTQDIWYTFTATSTVNLLSIDVQASYFDAYYRGFELVAGDCATGSMVICQSSLAVNHRELLPDLTPGQVYFLRLLDFNQGANDYSICLTALPTPLNDACVNAVPVTANPDLTCTTTYAGTTAGATSGTGGFSLPDVWYSFTANNDALFFELLNVEQYYGRSSSLQYEIFHGSTCDDWQLVGYYYPAQTWVGGLIPGDTYFIRVFSFDAYSAHDFELCLQTPPPPPPNDLCTGALPLTPNAALACDLVTHGTTAGAVLDGSQACYSGGPLYDVWYSFVATSAVHKVEASNLTALTTAGDNEFELVVLQSADCVNFTRLACSEYGYAMTVQGLIPGQTYYVVAVSRQHVWHEFDLCVTSYPIPPNDLCADAVALPVAPTPACDSPTAGTGLASTTSSPATCGVPGGDVWYHFTATQATQTILVTSVFDALNGDYTYFDLEVFGNDCGSLQPLACRTDNLYGADWTIGELTPGQTYWIRVAGGAVFNICVTTPADQPPANDGCAGATPLVAAPGEQCLLPTVGTTAFATPSNPDGSIPNANTYQDVWYSFTATQPTHAVVLNNFDNSFGGGLSVQFYSGTCGALSQETLQLYQLNGELVWLTSDLTPGQTYYVRVFNAVYNQPNTFDLCVISMAPPANDECVNAQPLTASTDLSCSQILHTTNLGATQSRPDCAGNAARDVWYQFTATATTARLDISANYGLSSDYAVEILEGDCAAPTVFLPCTDYNYDQVLLLPNLVLGQTYYLRFLTAPVDYKNFTLCLRELPAPPANDDCAQAAILQPSTGLACGQVTDGTTVAAGGTEVGCNGYPPSDDVWYQFVATSTSHVLRLVVEGYPLGDGGYPGFELYAGADCNSAASVTCHYFNGSVGGEKFLYNLVVGATYFIRVFAERNHPYDFSICLGTLPTAPPNAECAGAFEIIPSPDMQCAQPVAGTTAGLPETIFSPYCSSGTSLWYHFKATATAHFIQLQNVVHLYGSPMLELGLYQASDCSNLYYSLYCSQQGEILATNLVPGTNYYLRVGGNVQSGSTFDLCVLTLMPPANDNCAGVVVLPVSPTEDCGGQVSGSNVGATGSYGISCGNGPDVLYAFTAAGPKHWVNFSNGHSSNGSNFVEVLTGACGNWTGALGCYSVYSSPIQLQNLVPGKTYYLRIGSEFPSYVSFNICITSPQPDVDILAITPYSDGCQPGSNETVEVSFRNSGSGDIAANAAQFTLTVSGANQGTYGPISNADPLDFPFPVALPFTGVDLSNPGQSQLTVTATLPNDLDVANNTQSRSFTSVSLLTTFYQDADDDGHGDPAVSVQVCFPPAGYVANRDDCDDSNDQIYLGAPEVCDGFDNDCDGLTDTADPGLVNAPLPAITCPAAISINHDPGTCSAVVNYTVTTTDNCGYVVTQADGLASGAAFPLGTTLNTFRVSDLAGTSAHCSFTVTVEKTADPDLAYAYTVIGLNDVFLQNNTVLSGGVGVVNAGKKARLQSGTMVTAANSFVKAPVLELTDGSLVTTAYTGQVPTSLLPSFQLNNLPTSNNLTVADHAAPVTLTLSSYGNITVGLNATIIFSGSASVRIRELTLKAGAKVLFEQNTNLLINRGITIGRNVDFNPGGAHSVYCFAGKTVTAGYGTKLRTDLYTLVDLRLEKATATTGITMTGQFIASNVYAGDFATWQWDAARCPASVERPDETEVRQANGAAPPADLGQLRIFPNPASDRVQLSFDLAIVGEVTVQILDVAGRPVLTERFAGPAGTNQHEVGLGNLPKGMYVVRVVAEGQQWVEKLVLRE